MATDFDDFPLYDPLVKTSTDYMSAIWQSSLATFIDTLQDYLSQNGIFVPKVTTAQRDALQNVTNGQMIYNTTTNKFQGRENNVWTNFI